MKHMKFGKIIKARRIELGFNLRKFCLQTDRDPSNWSKIERGLLPPPQDVEALRQIAQQLEIDENSEKWFEFINSAYLTRGEIPPYIRENKSVMEKLPLFFRTVTGNKPRPEELDELAAFLQKHH